MLDAPKDTAPEQTAVTVKRNRFKKYWFYGKDRKTQDWLDKHNFTERTQKYL